MTAIDDVTPPRAGREPGPETRGSETGGPEMGSPETGSPQANNPLAHQKEAGDPPADDVLASEILADDPQAESHRAFVREIDARFAKTYGYGGGLVLLTVLASLTGAWYVGVLARPASWMITLTLALVMLYVVRARVGRERATLVGVVEQYCAANELPVARLRTYFARQQMYPFFGALFERRSIPGPDPQQADNP